MMARLNVLDNHLSDLKTDGFTVLKRQLSKQKVAKVQKDLDQWFAITPPSQGLFYGSKTTRFGSLLAKCPSTQDLALNATIQAMCQNILGPHCDWFQLNLSQAIRIHPGQPAQPVHRDDDMWPVAKTNEHLINVIWAIDPFTRENGATRLWRNEGVESEKREADEADAIIAEMEPGDALVFLGSTLHGGGHNQSRIDRTGIIFSYSLGWLKPYENPFLAYPPEIARQFSKELQDLIGYRVHRPNLGGYENNDPSILLKKRISGLHAIGAIDCLPPHLEAEAKRRADAAREAEAADQNLAAAE